MAESIYRTCSHLSCNRQFVPNRVGNKQRFCSLSCYRANLPKKPARIPRSQSEFQEVIRSDKLAKWKNGEWNGSQKNGALSKWVRNYILKKFSNKCALCGWNKTNPFHGNCPVEVEHIDGNYQNNTEENLTLICPNCHSLTATYRGLNRGNGREYRKGGRSNPL